MTPNPEAAFPDRSQPADVPAPRRRILLYGLNFAPEPTGVGKFTGEMAQWLAARGHEVRVITSVPYYPQWQVARGYRGWAYRTESWQGVTVHRVPLWVPRVPGGVKRVVHLASYAAASLPALTRVLRWRPDVLWCAAPALISAPAAVAAARASGALSWLHIQDFEVDAAFEMGMLRGASARRLALGAERRLLRAFDRVSTISLRMLERLRSKGVDQDRSLLFPNWVDTSAILARSAPSGYRARLGISSQDFVVLFSGTMGAKQGLEGVAAAARRLQEAKRIHFVFCGQGAGRAELERACQGLARVHFLPLQPVEQLDELLCLADVHVLPQRRAAADLVLPSKLTGMLASGRPVVATVEPDTEIARWIEGCGVRVAPEDDAALAQALLELSNASLRCRNLGEEARRRAVDRLSIQAVLGEFERAMEAALSQRRQRRAGRWTADAQPRRAEGKAAGRAGEASR